MSYRMNYADIPPATYEVPGEIKELFDHLAGKVHSADGTIMSSLRLLLWRHEQVVREQVASEQEGGER